MSKKILNSETTELETNVDLGIALNSGNADKSISDMSEEEKQIAKSRGADIDNKDKVDGFSYGVANFRIISR